MSQRAYACPQCGGTVQFQSSVTTFAVCPYCQSMIVRTDEGIQNLGEMAQLPPDLSPLQIGTRGEWQGQPFQLLGRLRLEYEAGSWTEWYALLADGRTGWLAEAQGFFMFTLPHPAREMPTKSSDLVVNPAVRARIDGQFYRVLDIKTVQVVAAEGELPDVSPPGTRRENADLAAPGGVCGTLEFHEEGPEFYLGKYAAFEELKLRELRPVPGWDAAVPAQNKGAKALSCPQCGAAVELRAAGQTQSAVCGSCNTLIDTANPVWHILQKGESAKQPFKPIIPIGARGELFGTKWEVIGLQRRGNREVSWFEYLLFNPWRGFCFLTTWGGHWNFVERLLDVPDLTGSVRLYQGKRYAAFARGEVTTMAVLGEFYWKVARGEQANFIDYVHPPELLSYEYYPALKEETFSLGHYVEPSVIREAFQTPSLAWRQGVFANQPNPWKRRLRTILPFFIVAFVAAVGIEISQSGGEHQQLWSGQFAYVRQAAPPVVPGYPPPPQQPPPTLESDGTIGMRLPSTPAPATPRTPLGAGTPTTTTTTEGGATPATPPPDPNNVTSPRFQIRGTKTQAVTVYVTAPVSNSWIGFDVELVNVQTQQVYPGGVEVSYYFGHDSDGDWTEGSTSSSADIAEVPPGEYYLSLDPEADPNLAGISWTVRAESGGLFAGNFFLTMIMIFAWPVFIFFRGRAWESARWAEADFSR